MYLCLLFIGLATANPVTLMREENAALEAAVDALQEENTALRTETTELRAAITEKDKVISAQATALEAAHKVVWIDNQQKQLWQDQLVASEKLAAEYEALYRTELKRQPPTWERALWAGGVLLLGGALSYSVIDNTLGD